MTENVYKLYKRPPGTPTKMTEEVVRDLEYAFRHGASDREACLYVGICKETLYSYQRRTKGFADRKELLKSDTSLRAKLNVGEAIRSGDKQLSTWWLERKERAEFGTVNQNVNMNIDAKDLLTDEDKARLNALMQHGGSTGTEESNT